MKSLNELTGQRPEYKRGPPLSANSCSCAAALRTAAHQTAAFMKELTKKLVWNPACQIAGKGLGLRKPRLIGGSHEESD
jgi:hypothetical protein